jgi:hypothetical protein
MFIDKLDWNLDRIRSKDIWSHLTAAEYQGCSANGKRRRRRRKKKEEEKEDDQKLSQFYGNSQ